MGAWDCGSSSIRKRSLIYLLGWSVCGKRIRDRDICARLWIWHLRKAIGFRFRSFWTRTRSPNVTNTCIWGWSLPEHAIGWGITGIAILLFLGAALLAIGDGIRNHFSYWQFFARFVILLYGMEIYDILFFDWVLLCHSNFFPRFYPELKGIVGPHQFGYNKKAHMIHFAVYIPACTVVAGLCTLFGGV